jgi:chromosome partitioning protein
LARTTGKRAIVVPNWVAPGSLTEERTIRGIAESHGLPTAPVALHRYTVHKEASLLGLTASELDPNSKAASELHALWDWLCAELQMIQRAQVHKVA